MDVFGDVYRRLDDWLLADDAGRVTPVAKPFVKLGTWIGGDRDGNPNVTAEVTRQAAALAGGARPRGARTAGASRPGAS